jgi:apolipoprotein N-acyltransferase
VLSEYTLDGPVPESLSNWCRKHARHLVVGGKQPLSGEDFYNTAFVVGPTGDVLFKQVKNVPIQFFADGLPAPERKVWESPWGRIGLAVCYDLNYRRVIDDFIRLGAQALIIPTMDVTQWGENQHRLHARVAPVRSAEYGVPIFRLCSSGISQLTDRDGRVLASLGFPGQGEIIGGTMVLADPGRLPWDSVLAQLAALVTFFFLAWSVVQFFKGRMRRPR